MADSTKSYKTRNSDPLFEAAESSSEVKTAYSTAISNLSTANFIQLRQTLKFTQTAAFDDSNQTWEEYVKGNFEDYINQHSSPTASIRDITFTRPVPSVIKDFSPFVDQLVGINEVKEEFVINFLEQKYESAIASSNVEETSLPNFYQTLEDLGSVTDSYFDKYADNIPPADTRYENIMIPMDNYKELGQWNNWAPVFPLETRLSPINASIVGPTEVITALDKSNLDCLLMKTSFLMDGRFEQGELESVLPFEYATLEMTQTYSDGALSAQVISRSLLDLLGWSRDVVNISHALSADKVITNAIPQNKIYLGPNNQAITVAENKGSDLEKILASASFLMNLKSIIPGKARSYEDLVAKKESYSEILFYKIEKRSSVDAYYPVQTIWIPNIPQINPLEYIDTQVKYNKTYYYRVFAYNMVVGTKYYYDASTFEASYDSTTVIDYVAGPDPHTSVSDLAPVSTTTGGVPNVGYSVGTTQNLQQSGIVTTNPNLGAGLGFDPYGQKLGAINASGFKPLQTNQSAPPPVDLTSVAHPFFKVGVVCEPTVDLIRTEFFDFHGTILDDPPMIPDVNFISYVDVDNTITVDMRAQIGEYKGPAVILNSSEAQYIDDLRSVRGLSSSDLITYRTDDEIASFEIYRCDTLPTSYNDFSSKLRDTTSTLQRSDFDLIYSWSSSYEDKIEPNKIYYYMIRAVDIHGHKSFPSPVYKVTLVNDSGAIYPLIDTIEIKPPPKSQQKTKSFKKFLQLVPNVAQVMVDYEAGIKDSAGLMPSSAFGHEEDIELGVVAPKLFGKPGRTFKVRLVSKNTGKKLDLNITFNVENEL